MFPSIVDFARSLGADFRVVDLRWGIPDEASHRHSVVEMCLGEVDRALNADLEPRLLWLLGQRYGWRPLPPWILPLHLERLERRAAAPPGADAAIDDAAVELIRTWYPLDKNAVSPHLALRSAHDIPHHEWEIVEHRLRAALETIAGDDAWLEANGQSLTEREVRRGLARRERALAVVRAVADVAGAPTSAQEKLSEADPVLRDAQQRLCDDVRRLLPAANVFDAVIGWQAAVDPHLAAPAYEASFTQMVHDWLSSQIRGSIEGYAVRRSRLRASEVQFAAAQKRADAFAERWSEFERLNDAVESRSDAPILVEGCAGSGKSTLMSRLWVERVARGDRIFGRFAAEGGDLDPRSLMQGLLRELLVEAGEAPPAPRADSVAISRFRRVLAETAVRGPMLLLIDGVDEIAGLAKTLARWLPARVPEGTSIVISLRAGSDADILRKAFSGAQSITLAGLSAAGGGALLDRWLSGSGRQLQPAQRSGILTAFEQEGTPLWLSIAFERARSWRSFDEVPHLPPSLDGLIGKLVIQRVLDPGRHLPEFSMRAVAVIAASRYGLTEAELIESISADDSFWTAFEASQRWTLPERRIPDALWGRLKADLEPYFADAGVSSNTLVRFKHTAFTDYVRDTLTTRSGLEPHDLLARMFLHQPLYFVDESRAEPNRRKLAELPYQLIRSGRLGELIELLVGEPSWRRARAEVEPDDQGFIGDLDLALDALPEVPHPSAIRSAVRLTVARGQADLVRLAYGDDELGLMVRLGLETRALSLAEEREDPGELASALTSIAEAIAEVGGVTDFDAINRAEAAAASLQNPWARMRLLGRLVVARAQMGDRDRAASSIEHLRTLEGATSGDEAERGKHIVYLVERLVSLGQSDLAKQAAELEPGDARVWSGPHASGVLARAEAAAGRLDAAIGRLAAFEHGTFDYGVMCWHLLSGAARHGAETLIRAASSVDLGTIPDRQRYDIALILRDQEQPLRRLLEPVFHRARTLVPELAAVRRQRAAAPAPPLHIPLDLNKALDEWTWPGAAALRTADLDSEARRLDLVLFGYFAARLQEPWVEELLPMAQSLIDFGGHDYRAFYEYAAATGIVLGPDAAMPLFRDAVGISLSAGRHYKSLGSLDAQVQMLARVADGYLRASIGPCSALIGALDDLHARATQGLGFLAMEGLSPEQRDEILADWRGNLPRIDRLDDLRAMGRSIRVSRDHELGDTVLRRIEDVLRRSFAVEAETLRNQVAPMALEGIARLDPSAALRDARAGMLGSPIEAVTSLAKFLAGRRDEPHTAAPFVEAARFAREHADSVFLPGSAVLVRLLILGETDEAILLSRRQIGPWAVRRRARTLDVIKAFVTTGRLSELWRVFEESGIEPAAEWLFHAARQAQAETGPRDLEPEELRSLNAWYSAVDICELGLAALDLGIPAGKHLVSSAIENAASGTDEARGGDGLRSDALRDLVSLLSRRGAPARAAQALSRMQRSGGDGLNHQDWTRAIGDVGVAYCASGEVAAALHLIERLNLHDADERAAASAVRRAAASAFADAGDLAAAEQQIALIPDAPARRAASAVVVRYYARSGDYRSALRHIRSSRMSGNIEQCVEVVNLLVEQKFIGTIEDYNAIVAAMESNPASSRERA